MKYNYKKTMQNFENEFAVETIDNRIYLMNMKSRERLYEPVAEVIWDSESPIILFYDDVDEVQYSPKSILDGEYTGPDEFTEESKIIAKCFK